MSSSNAADKREAQILDPNSDENRQYARDKAADPELFAKPKSHPDSTQAVIPNCDATLPAVIGNHGLHPRAFRALSLYEASGEIGDL